MKLLIVVHHRFDLWNVPTWFTERVRQEFPELEVVHRDTYDGAEQHLRDSEIVFTISLRPEQFAVAQKLRWLHTPTAAVHQLLFPALANSDVVLTNSSEVHGPVVAEHVIALMCALAKKIPQAVRLQQEHAWGKETMWKESPRPRELAGATLGLIGLGSIGLRVARMASALGMYVIATRENLSKEKPEGVSAVFAASAIEKMLSQSDYVVMAAPLTPATQGLMNAARFAAMKPDAYLINVGRGPQVDEVALAHALRTRCIAGAALDVFEQEPLPADSPLWELDNLLITPHTAGITEKLWHRHYELFSKNLRRYLAGKPLLFTVDKQRGY
jgi:D-2-hydroxyacid dehydrogenase (NADP+)